MAEEIDIARSAVTSASFTSAPSLFCGGRARVYEMACSDMEIRNDHTPFFVAFSVNNADRFEALCAAFEAIKHDKNTGERRTEEDWLAYFDDEALAHFWWPSEEEKEEYWRRGWSIPTPQRLADPTLQPPSWDFLSMIGAFHDGEYVLLTCRMLDERNGRIEFEPQAFPYGGTQCMQMLVQAFGFAVAKIEDGSLPG